MHIFFLVSTLPLLCQPSGEIKKGYWCQSTSPMVKKESTINNGTLEQPWKKNY